MKHKPDEEWQRELGGLRLEKRRLRVDLALHNSLTGGDSQGGKQALPPWNSLELCQERFRLDTGKTTSGKGWSGIGTGYPVVESPP